MCYITFHKTPVNRRNGVYRVKVDYQGFIVSHIHHGSKDMQEASETITREQEQVSVLDLSDGAIGAFFRQRDAKLDRGIRSMESVEVWTLDRVNEVQTALERMGDKLATSGDISSSDEGDASRAKDLVMSLLAYTKTGRGVRLLMHVDQHYPGFVARMIQDAMMLSAVGSINPKACELMVDRFQTLDRMHLIARIFAPERVQTVIEALRSIVPETMNQEAQGAT